MVKAGIVEKLPDSDDIPVHVTNCDTSPFTVPAGFKIGSWLPLSSQQLDKMGALSDKLADIENEIKQETRDFVSMELSLAKEVYEDTAGSLLSLAPENSVEDEFWEKEDYMSAPVSTIKPGEFDIPMDASRDDILATLRNIYAKLDDKQIESSPTLQKKLNIAASRLFDRLLLPQCEEEQEQPQLPESIDFMAPSYAHLTPEQINLVRNQLQTEASFFYEEHILQR